MMIRRVINKFIPKKPVRVNAFILGAQKAGTTSLHSYISHHPQVKGAYRKEVHFFNRPLVYEKGATWYHDQFPKVPVWSSIDPIYIDATPVYLFDPGVPKLLHAYNPDARLVILLRNPIDRAYSHWNMFRQIHSLPSEEKQLFLKTYSRGNTEQELQELKKLVDSSSFPDFSTAIEQDIKRVEEGVLSPYGWVARGLYKNQLKRYFDLFSPDQIHIIDTSELEAEPKSTTETTADFIGVEKWDWNELSFDKTHVRSYETTMDDQVRDRLSSFFRPHNEELFNFLSRRFDWD